MIILVDWMLGEHMFELGVTWGNKYPMAYCTTARQASCYLILLTQTLLFMQLNFGLVQLGPDFLGLDNPHD